jgi:hypothetical protein
MQRFGLWLALLMAAGTPTFAQVTAEVLLEQEQFLPGEALPVAVRITNRSGQTLRLGEEADWLTFGIESREGDVVAKTAEVPVVGKFILESSQKGTRRVDIAPYFALSRSGRYAIEATIKITNWDQEITTRPKEFNIIEGTKLWEQVVGVPRSAKGNDETPELRHYMLQQANYLKKELRLYLRVTDESQGKILKATPIGPLLSFSRPVAEVDKQSNLHVLYQNGPQSYSYTMFNTEGELMLRQTHDYVKTRPRLQADTAGNISVAGGERRVTARDIPPAKREATPE